MMRTRFGELLRFLNNAILVYTAGVGLMALFGEVRPILLLTGLLPVLLVAAYTLISPYFENLIMFTLAHLVVLAGYVGLCVLHLMHPGDLFVPGVTSRNITAQAFIVVLFVLRMVIGFICTVAAYANRLGDKPLVEPDLWLSAFFILIYIIGHIEHSATVKTLAVVMQGIEALLAVLQSNQQGLALTIRSFSESSHVPEGDIRGTNRLMLTLFMIGAALLTGLGVLTGLAGPFLALVGRGFMAVIRFLLSFITPGEESEGMPEEVVGGATDMSQAMPVMEGEENPIWQYIWMVLGYVIGVVVFAVIAYLLVKGLIAFYREFRQISLDKGESTDEREFLRPREEKQSLLRDGEDAVDTPSLLDRNRSARARRIYRDWIRGNMPRQRRGLFRRGERKGSQPVTSRLFPGNSEEAGELREGALKSAWTPSEIEAHVLGEKSRDEKALRAHRLYEEARYSGREISEEALRELQEAVRG